MNTVEDIFSIAKRVGKNLNPSVKETLKVLHKDEGGLGADELLQTAHALEGVPLSSDVKTVINAMKEGREAKTILNSKGVTNPQISNLNMNIDFYKHKKDNLIGMHHKTKNRLKKGTQSPSVTKAILSKYGKQVLTSNKSLKDSEELLKLYNAMERYNIIKKELGLVE